MKNIYQNIEEIENEIIARAKKLPVGSIKRSRMIQAARKFKDYRLGFSVKDASEVIHYGYMDSNPTGAILHPKSIKIIPLGSFPYVPFQD